MRSQTQYQAEWLGALVGVNQEPRCSVQPCARRNQGLDVTGIRVHLPICGVIGFAVGGDLRSLILQIARNNQKIVVQANRLTAAVQELGRGNLDGLEVVQAQGQAVQVVLIGLVLRAGIGVAVGVKVLGVVAFPIGCAVTAVQRLERQLVLVLLEAPGCTLRPLDEMAGLVVVNGVLADTDWDFPIHRVNEHTLLFTAKDGDRAAFLQAAGLLRASTSIRAAATKQAAVLNRPGQSAHADHDFKRLFAGVFLAKRAAQRGMGLFLANQEVGHNRRFQVGLDVGTSDKSHCICLLALGRGIRPQECGGNIDIDIGCVHVLDNAAPQVIG